MSYCVNCGNQLGKITSICQNCSSDPKIPNEIIDKLMSSFPSRSPKSLGFPNLEYPGETTSLAFAILFSVIIGTLFSFMTLGLFLFYLILGLIYMRIREAQTKSNLVKTSERTNTRIYNLSRVSAYRLKTQLYPVYIKHNPNLNAYTSGFWGNHWVVLYSGLVDKLTDAELLFILGHEMGHIKREHATWLNLISPARNHSLPLVSEGLRLIFNNWALKAEYSADRAGLIASSNLTSCISALLKLSTANTNMDISEYINEFEKHSMNPMYKISEYFGDHPFIPNRIKKLQEFSKNKPEYWGAQK